MTERQAGSSTMLMAVAAGAIGAGIALLLAPRSGRETRHKLHEAADEMKQRAHENLDLAKDAVGESLDKASEMQRKVASAIRTRKPDTKKPENNGDIDNTHNTQSLNKWEEEQ
jgi:gas vesicle protein